jgi:26S proteasome regulatory subunit N5
MSDGQILKPDKDFSKEVDKQLPEAEELAKVYSRGFADASPSR